MNLHWHEECEIIRVKEGYLEIVISGKKYLAKAGDILFVNSSELHEAIPHDCIYECIVFDLAVLLRERVSYNGLIYELLYEKITIPHELTKLNNRKCNDLLNALFDLMIEQAEGFKNMVSGILLYLLGLLEKEHLFVHESEKPLNKLFSDKIIKIKTAIAFIHRCYKSDIQLKELSDILEVSEQSAIKFFKDYTHQSPKEYIRAYRVEVAKMLIKRGMSMLDVALETGFNDCSYFTKVFKRYTGKTPTEYYNSMIKED